MSSPPVLPDTAKNNIRTVVELEQQLLRQRSPAERVGNVITRFFASSRFIAAQAVFLAGWIFVNAGGIPLVPAFDPYPFPFLALVVGVEFIFLTTFVLINQKHQMQRAEQWSRLHLQLSVLAEQEITKSLQILHLISQRLGLQAPAEDQQAMDLAHATPVATLADEIEKARGLADQLEDRNARAER